MILEKRIPIKYWFNMIKKDLCIVTVLSVVVYTASTSFIPLALPISIGTFMGTAIALLLSFKLSQSYERWWEARKIWGSIVNDSRSLVKQVKHFSTGDQKYTRRIALRQIAWCFSLGQALRKLDALKGLASYLETDEYESLQNQKNVPLKLLECHEKDIARLHTEKSINDYQQVQVNNTIVRLCSSMGQAERIKNTCFPKTYRTTLYLFIYIFLVILSISLSEIESLSVAEIPLMIAISIPFLLLEKVAYTIQNPFENTPSDTPVTTIAETIEINLLQLIDEHENSRACIG